MATGKKLMLFQLIVRNRNYRGLDKSGKSQNYICVNCGRQFIKVYEPQRGYSEEMKRECLKMYVNGLGFRAIERVKNVHHTTIMNWVKQVVELLPDYYDPQTIPDVGELDELETFVGSKKAARPRAAERRKGMLAILPNHTLIQQRRFYLRDRM